MRNDMTRAEHVRINRLMSEYRADVLPHPEQIRNDVYWLIVLAARLETQLQKVCQAQ
jgi:hypothetical protein